MTLRFFRRRVRLQRRWPFVVTWQIPPTTGKWYRLWRLLRYGD